MMSRLAVANNLSTYQATIFDWIEPKVSLLHSKIWDSFRFIDLFAGIGGIRLGFESVGGRCVFLSEWDEQAAKTYEANFGETPSGDITQIDATDILKQP